MRDSFLGLLQGVIVGASISLFGWCVLDHSDRKARAVWLQATTSQKGWHGVPLPEADDEWADSAPADEDDGELRPAVGEF